MRIDCKIEKPTGKPLLILHAIPAKAGSLTVYDGHQYRETEGGYLRCCIRNPKSIGEHGAVLALLARWLKQGE